LLAPGECLGHGAQGRLDKVATIGDNATPTCRPLQKNGQVGTQVQKRKRKKENMIFFLKGCREKNTLRKPPTLSIVVFFTQTWISSDGFYLQQLTTKLWKIADALFRISKMTNSLLYVHLLEPLLFICWDPAGVTWTMQLCKNLY
jgi:hypothetical protein